jgi:hypothetical protein
MEVINLFDTHIFDFTSEELLPLPRKIISAFGLDASCHTSIKEKTKHKCLF